MGRVLTCLSRESSVRQLSHGREHGVNVEGPHGDAADEAVGAVASSRVSGAVLSFRDPESCQLAMVTTA